MNLSKAEMLEQVAPGNIVSEKRMVDLGIPPGPPKEFRAPANPAAPEFHAQNPDYEHGASGPIAKASNYLGEKYEQKANVNLEFTKGMVVDMVPGTGV